MYTPFIVYISVVLTIIAAIMFKKVRTILGIIAGGGAAVALYFIIGWGLV